jgi:ferredoxin
MAEPRTELAIDWTRCDGHGLCAALLPAAISRDQWGYPVLDAGQLIRQPVADLNRVVSACPALALRRAG